MFFIGVLLIGTLLINGWLFMRISDSIGYENRYWGFIPILNWIMIADMSKISRLYVLLIFIPYINFIGMIYLLYKFFKVFAPSKALLYTILSSFVPFVMVIILYNLPKEINHDL